MSINNPTRPGQGPSPSFMKAALIGPAGLTIVYAFSGIFSGPAENAPDEPKKSVAYDARLTMTPAVVAGNAPACQTEEALGPYAEAIRRNDVPTAQRYFAQDQCEILGPGLKRDVASIDIDGKKTSLCAHIHGQADCVWMFASSLLSEDGSSLAATPEPPASTLEADTQPATKPEANPTHKFMRIDTVVRLSDDAPGCPRLEDYSKIRDLIGQGDEEAALKMVESGACKKLDEGSTAILQDQSIWNRAECVRPRGEVNCLWVSLDSVEEN
ncbi:MAG: hypothetical protein ABSA13_18955 [Beijerinckiaceae bacterium]